MNMNQTTSPALSQVETAIRVPAGNFAKYNYYSVFDIVRQTRKQFINANMSWPGSRGGIATSLPSEQSVDETLAQTRYPTLLPYHFPYDQVELSLLNTDVSLEDIISESSIDWPWFLSNSLTGDNSNYAMELASRLSPEQQTLPTEPDNSTTTDLTSFYQTNLGLKTADYTPFEALNTFARQLTITVPPGGTVDCGYSACQPAV
ncbi:virulence protein SpvA [Salmonella enterica subsp. houtenae]|uniref:Virulence protein SpvA n=1 Tax=Salmonella enterica TaxID=28901 RepID=A0A704VAJ3_SALER|nr:virulence protein SpvA [Salmonella enterica]EBH8336907.1 virulence protein SpvA [Salmonella enterica subsp. houtenae serovar Houten]ECD9547411.1 virulence protein SpvA [Salmonella enterica subsp. houtenae]ECM3644822.1 virulence protein SpvA [Salmonella enterica subsp. enterica serovar Typhimurium]EDS4969756.1 virulence protein SpvA [Salmonella enterica subsp. enterica serovar O rough]EDU9922108.1 virulence protein SpvA [Salmonella enterica subsp. enterica]OSD47480.1 virulence protein SpvA 